MKNVTVFNRALNHKEVTALFNSGSGVFGWFTYPLTVWWLKHFGLR